VPLTLPTRPPREMLLKRWPSVISPATGGRRRRRRATRSEFVDLARGRASRLCSSGAGFGSFCGERGEVGFGSFGVGGELGRAEG
jgi:hypothetical protein